MVVSNFIQEPGMQKFFSPEFGFLHVIEKDGRLWFNMTDICQALRIQLREALSECDIANCEIREYNVRRTKFSSCNRFTDEDGMHTILIESRKNRANAYRQWIEAVVCFSVRNPQKSLALREIELSGNESSYEVRRAYMVQAKANESIANALIQKYISDKEEAEKKTAKLSSPKPKKSSKKKKTNSAAWVASTSVTQKKAQAQYQSKKLPEPDKFIPKYGHMTVEEFFRTEIPYHEFCYLLEGVLADAQAHIVLLDETSRWNAQHRINVVRVFKTMLKANAGNLVYTPPKILQTV